MAAESISTERRAEVRRPAWTRTAIGSWITTTDHKKIGILYMYTAILFFMLGGIEALIMRTQLGTPNNTLIKPELYNELFTMHGTIMIFLFLMPMWTGFGNYIVPLMIGARDMAFPRLNLLGYWFFVSGAFILAFSLVIGQAPNVGWFAYAPLTEATPACLGGVHVSAHRRRPPQPRVAHRAASRRARILISGRSRSPCSAFRPSSLASTSS
jgi:cytochrome c oxidase subunit 1